MGFLKTRFLVCFVFMFGVLAAQENTNLQKAFSESFKLEEEQKYSEAVAVLKNVYLPDHYEINLRLGWLSYNTADFEASNEYYEVATQLMPYAIEPKLGATLPKSKLNKWDEVEQLYNDVLSIAPKNSVALYNLGLIYYNRTNYLSAYDKFKDLSNLFPTDYDALLMYAWTSLKMGKNREAKVLFHKVLLLYPSDTSARLGLDLLK